MPALPPVGLYCSSGSWRATFWVFNRLQSMTALGKNHIVVVSVPRVRMWRRRDFRGGASCRRTSGKHPAYSALIPWNGLC